MRTDRPGTWGDPGTTIDLQSAARRRLLDQLGGWAANAMVWQWAHERGNWRNLEFAAAFESFKL
ncbi:MAG TPA: hypothetical protein VMP10_03315, partial [Chloroflexota bacterium]|nr:hypothetical protein [Chloroflexota bacterium]